jgi:hypothetical protein
MDWTHIFAVYKGLWVGLADDEVTVLGAGKTLTEAMALAGPEAWYFRVPEADAYFCPANHVD